MPIPIFCTCGKHFLLNDEFANKRIRCSNCQTVILAASPTSNPVPSPVQAPPVAQQPSLPLSKPPRVDSTAASPPFVALTPAITTVEKSISEKKRLATKSRQRKPALFWTRKKAVWLGISALILLFIAGTLTLNNWGVIELPSAIVDNLPAALNDRGYRGGKRLTGTRRLYAFGYGHPVAIEFLPDGRFNFSASHRSLRALRYQYSGTYEFDYDANFSRHGRKLTNEEDQDPKNYGGKLKMVTDDGVLLMDAVLYFHNEKYLAGLMVNKSAALSRQFGFFGLDRIKEKNE